MVKLDSRFENDKFQYTSDMELKKYPPKTKPQAKLLPKAKKYLEGISHFP